MRLMLVFVFVMRNHEELFVRIDGEDQDASQDQSRHEAKQQHPERHHIENTTKYY